MRELQRDVPEHLARLDPERCSQDPRERNRPRASSAARSCSGRRSRSSACSRAHSTSSTAARTGRFLRGKALATLMMVGSLAFLFASLVVGSVGAEILKRYTRAWRQRRLRLRSSRSASRCSASSSSSRRRTYVLTNDELTWREVLPGAVGRGVRARGDVPAPAGVRAHLEAQPGAADAVGAGGAARLALRDGERDRARRRGQLAAAA